MPENEVNDEAGTDEAKTPAPNSAPAFTQADMDALAAKTRTEARARAKQEADEAAAEAAKVAEREKMGEVDRLQAELVDAQSTGTTASERADAAERRASLILAAVSAGVQGAHIERFVKLATLEAADEPADAVKAILSEFPEMGHAPARSGAAEGAGSGTGPTFGDVSLAQFQGMTTIEIGKLAREDPEQYARLTEEATRERMNKRPGL